MFYRALYKYIYKMFTVWICIECLHRILKSKMTVELVSSVETEESVKKIFRVKNSVCTIMFSNRDCVLGE